MAEADPGEKESRAKTSWNKRIKRARVWNHFKLNKKEDGVVCNYCKQELAWHKSTTVMNYHLDRKHPGVFLEPGASKPQSTR